MRPRFPRFAGELDPDIVQVHSCNYVNPSQLKDGGVLIVGAGNSGADIAMEIVKNHRTWMAGKESGHVPFRIESFAGRFILIRAVYRSSRPHRGYAHRAEAPTEASSSSHAAYPRETR